MDDTKKIFIKETEDFFNRFKLPYEFRSNRKGECSFISKETDMILYYNGLLDLSISINFEKNIKIEIEHLNRGEVSMGYNMSEFRCRLFIVLEYIETHKKLHSLKNDLQNEKIGVKWKSKNILDNFKYIGELESVDDE